METAHGSAQQRFVWVKLYIGDVESRHPLKIRMGPGEDVSDLIDAIKAKAQPRLGHCVAYELDVYAPGTPFPIQNRTARYDVDAIPRDGTKAKCPLVVTAPPAPPPPQVSLPCNVVLISSLAFEFHRRSHRYFPSRKNLAT